MLTATSKYPFIFDTFEAVGLIDSDVVCFSLNKQSYIMNLKAFEDMLDTMVEFYNAI